MKKFIDALQMYYEHLEEERDNDDLPTTDEKVELEEFCDWLDDYTDSEFDLNEENE